MAILNNDKMPNCPNWDTNQKESLPGTEKQRKEWKRMWANHKMKILTKLQKNCGLWSHEEWRKKKKKIWKGNHMMYQAHKEREAKRQKKDARKEKSTIKICWKGGTARR